MGCIVLAQCVLVLCCGMAGVVWYPYAACIGRPKYRWEDNIIQDLDQMKIKNWLTVSRIEQSGRMSLRRPKPPIKGGSASEEEEEDTNNFGNSYISLW